MDELFWTETAFRDLDEIAAYITYDNPGGAERIVRRILETVAALAYHPRMGRPNEEDGRAGSLLVERHMW